MSRLNITDVVKAGYDPNKRNVVTNSGYRYDDDLSNHNQQVYYNPNEKKLLVNVTGSHNAKDWLINNPATLLGLSKSTDRTKEAGNTLTDTAAFVLYTTYEAYVRPVALSSSSLFPVTPIVPDEEDDDTDPRSGSNMERLVDVER